MGMLSLLQSDFPRYLTVVMTVIVSITFHELAHGYAAIRRGDRTPIERGHMTFNPLVHLGPFSILACLIAGIAWGQMPVDPSRLRGKYADAFVAFAGPLVNLVFAVVTLVALGLWLRTGPDLEVERMARIYMVLQTFGTINLLLFAFNLLPVPPLDGSRILGDFHRGFRDWAFDPANQGAVLMLFVAAWVLGGGIIVNYTRVASDTLVRLVAGF
jgi:Zn-dependent protease